MKITRYLYLIFIIALYVVNYFYLKISMLPFTGIVLALLIVLIIGINIYVRLRDRKKGLNDEDFIFPKPLADKMKTLDVGIQYESTIISLVLLIMGLVLFVVYIIFLTEMAWITKAFTVFNTVCALGLMGSMLVTNYQQYKSYKDSTKMLKEFTNMIGSEVSSVDQIMKVPTAVTEPTEEEKTQMWEKVIEESKSIKKDEEEEITERANTSVTLKGEVIDFTEQSSDKDLIEKLFNQNKNNQKGGQN